MSFKLSDTLVCGCINITRLPLRLQFVICASAVIGLHVVSSYYIQRTFAVDGFVYGNFFATAELIVTALCALIHHTLLSSVQEKRVSVSLPPTNITLTTYCALALLYSVTRGLTNTSLEYIDLSSQVILKSSKIIPIMIGGVILLKKRYSIGEFAAATVIVIGLALFALADIRMSSRYSLVGLVLVVLSVTIGSLYSNAQEYIVTTFAPTTDVMLFYVGSIGALYQLMFIAITGELFAALRFCADHPAIYFNVVAASAFAYCAMTFVFPIIRNHGAATVVIVTSTRKLLTVFVAVIAMNKPITLQYVTGAMLVFVGMSLTSLFHSPKASTQAHFSPKAHVMTQEETAVVSHSISPAHSRHRLVHSAANRRNSFALQSSVDDDASVLGALTSFMSMLAWLLASHEERTISTDDQLVPLRLDGTAYV